MILEIFFQNFGNNISCDCWSFVIEHFYHIDDQFDSLS